MQYYNITSHLIIDHEAITIFQRQSKTIIYECPSLRIDKSFLFSYVKGRKIPDMVLNQLLIQFLVPSFMN